MSGTIDETYVKVRCDFMINWSGFLGQISALPLTEAIQKAVDDNAYSLRFWINGYSKLNWNEYNGATW